jgi:hypothetical protein
MMPYATAASMVCRASVWNKWQNVCKHLGIKKLGLGCRPHVVKQIIQTNYIRVALSFAQILATISMALL